MYTTCYNTHIVTQTASGTSMSEIVCTQHSMLYSLTLYQYDRIHRASGTAIDMVTMVAELLNNMRVFNTQQMSAGIGY